MSKDVVHIAYCSGGKDSTAMMEIILNDGYPLDDVVYVDEGEWAFPEMNIHIAQCEERWGFPLTRLYPKEDFTHGLLYHKRKAGKLKDVIGHGFPWSKLRWCTQLKEKAINKYLQRYKGMQVVHYIGLAHDESNRVPALTARRKCIFPLRENKLTERQVLSYCHSLGYTWGGLYKWNSRVSCWCCPLQKKLSLFMLYIHRPELWAKLEEWDKILKAQNSPHVFRIFKDEKTVPELRAEFDRKIKRDKQGFNLCPPK